MLLFHETIFGRVYNLPIIVIRLHMRTQGPTGVSREANMTTEEMPAHVGTMAGALVPQCRLSIEA
jgi:hypothetical protein